MKRKEDKKDSKEKKIREKKRKRKEKKRKEEKRENLHFESSLKTGQNRLTKKHSIKYFLSSSSSHFADIFIEAS